MEYLVTAPEILATTAADVGEIGSAIIDANASAAGPTAGLVAAAKDEVSEAIAKLFGGYGQQYQAVLTKAAAFHDDFAQALTGAGNAYAQAEAANVEALGTSIQTLLGRAPTGGGSSGTSALISVVRTSVGPNKSRLGHGRHLQTRALTSDTWNRLRSRTCCRTSLRCSCPTCSRSSLPSSSGRLLPNSAA